MATKVFIQSLGCPKNLVDSEVISGVLRAAGYEGVGNPEEADVLLVNTCGFITPAVEEGIDAILNLVAIKQERAGCRLVVAGCMVQRYGDELRQEFPEVDLFIGVDAIANIAELLASMQAVAPEITATVTPPGYLMDCRTPRLVSTPAFRSYLKITEGCSNRCSYCLIPSLRGPLRSRQLADLIKEAQLLAEAGTKELTLVAQDLTAYGLDLGAGGERLPDLLRALLAETAIPWLRLLYLYPMRLNEELLQLVAANPRILPYFDIPLQHINDRILKAMNRPYTRSSVESLVRRIREVLPQAAIRTTFMVGFPGETEAEVAELAEFMAAARLDNVGIFCYSNEAECAAASLPEQCSDADKIARKDELMRLQAEISMEINQRKVGTVEAVLVEGLSRESDLLLEGRTRFQAAEIDGVVYITAGTCEVGDIVEVRITEAHPYDLVGEIVGTDEGGCE
ncbi:MAG: 30S ribosomal protein S12 methylthiotransferase RimO [Desulfobulbaceae bacterium]|nr:30S ribosomal protein S12 methylthiotransferase RimO [Desulfobulbaceae bacterium]